MVKMWESVLKGEVKQDVTSYKHIITSVFLHGALPFSGNSPPKDASCDFVLIERKSHTALYDQIANRAEENTCDKAIDYPDPGVFVIGPPGIGNSCSLNHVFLRCAAIKEVSEGTGKRKKPVIVCDRDMKMEDGRYLIFTPGPDPKVEVSYDYPDALNDRENIYLYEASKGSASGDKRVLHGYCLAFYVVVSNPNRDYLAGLRGSSRRICAHRWESEEAEEAQTVLGLQADPTVVARCGFSLRLLTTGQAGAVTAMQRVESALDAVGSHDDLESMARDIVHPDASQLTHPLALLTLKSEGDTVPPAWPWYAVCPVSDYIRQRLRSKLGTRWSNAFPPIVDVFDPFFF